MRLDPTFSTPQTLPGKAPQQSLTFEAVSRGRGRPDHEVMWSRARDRVDKCLECLSIDVLFLHNIQTRLSHYHNVQQWLHLK